MTWLGGRGLHLSMKGNYDYGIDWVPRPRAWRKSSLTRFKDADGNHIGTWLLYLGPMCIMRGMNPRHPLRGGR